MIFFIVRWTFQLAQAKKMGLDVAYSKLLSTYKHINETIPIVQLQMNVPGALIVSDQGHILVQQMLLRMAEVLNTQLQLGVKKTNEMAMN